VLHAKIARMPPLEIADIAANLARLRERVMRAAGRVGRQGNEIALVAVSKTFPVEVIRAAFAAGLRHFGENRVQEMQAKRPKLADLSTSWHFIGHLQSNKARLATELFDRIDSVDSLPLARKLDSAAGELGKRLPVLVEVHLGGEAAKNGVSESELPFLAESIATLPHLDLHGLMTVPPYSDDPGQARPHFRKLLELREKLSERLGRRLPTLSMGMSHDLEVAIEEGATEIRPGTALFGARSKKTD
jgi:pyridoxal phosphate enzyme (YggS family)